jgi:non-ribosomal peptide synthetase component F
VTDLPLLSEAQMKWLAHDLNQSAADYPRDEFAVSLMAERVRTTPDAIAARHGSKSITYAELEAQTNRFARHVQSVVPGQGERVALLIDRSLDMLVALIGVMKAGHAYVPLDPGHPETRLRQTLSAARPAALVCNTDAAEAMAIQGMATIRLDRELSTIAAYPASKLENLPKDADSTAYVIFTSGSTGTPKGVAISHRSLTNFLISMAREPGFTANDVIVAVTTISFDIAGLELYLPLVSGGSVVIADRSEVEDGFALVRLIKESGGHGPAGDPDPLADAGGSRARRDSSAEEAVWWRSAAQGPGPHPRGHARRPLEHVWADRNHHLVILGPDRRRRRADHDRPSDRQHRAPHPGHRWPPGTSRHHR